MTHLTGRTTLSRMKIVIGGGDLINEHLEEPSNEELTAEKEDFLLSVGFNEMMRELYHSPPATRFFVNTSNRWQYFCMGSLKNLYEIAHPTHDYMTLSFSTVNGLIRLRFAEVKPTSALYKALVQTTKRMPT
jgi:hypothetical protein